MIAAPSTTTTWDDPPETNSLKHRIVGRLVRDRFCFEFGQGGGRAVKAIATIIAIFVARCSHESYHRRGSRIVVPKSLRLALGLQPGQALEIRAVDGRLEIEIAPTPMRLKKRGKGMVAVPDADLPALTADLVRETLERIRR
jgi:AbrB family looped-hinge helix DNA binding protein